MTLPGSLPQHMRALSIWQIVGQHTSVEGIDQEFQIGIAVKLDIIQRKFGGDPIEQLRVGFVKHTHHFCTPDGFSDRRGLF